MKLFYKGCCSFVLKAALYPMAYEYVVAVGCAVISGSLTSLEVKLRPIIGAGFHI